MYFPISRAVFAKLLKLFKRPSAPKQTPAAKAARQRAMNAATRFGRRQVDPRDLVLSAQAQNWMRALPPPARPNELASRYPRICNHFAAIWADGEVLEHYFNSLLVDDRGSRKGFSPQIGAELIRLHVFYANTKSSPHAAKAWDDRMLAVGDR